MSKKLPSIAKKAIFPMLAYIHSITQTMWGSVDTAPIDLTLSIWDTSHQTASTDTPHVQCDGMYIGKKW